MRFVTPEMFSRLMKLLQTMLFRSIIQSIFVLSIALIDQSQSTESSLSQNEWSNDRLLFNNTQANLPKSRKKRYLAFPEGSTFSVNLIFSSTRKKISIFFNFRSHFVQPSVSLAIQISFTSVGPSIGA